MNLIINISIYYSFLNIKNQSVKLFLQIWYIIIKRYIILNICFYITINEFILIYNHKNEKKKLNNKRYKKKIIKIIKIIIILKNIKWNKKLKKKKIYVKKKNKMNEWK